MHPGFVKEVYDAFPGSLRETTNKGVLYFVPEVAPNPPIVKFAIGDSLFQLQHFHHPRSKPVNIGGQNYFKGGLQGTDLLLPRNTYNGPDIIGLVKYPSLYVGCPILTSYRSRS